jgi:phage N-6-adenine-methyltransferase
MNDHWNTPAWVLELIYDFCGHLSLDPCSNATSLVCSDHRYTVRDNGLIQPWFGNVFVNPPYSRGNLALWTQKALREYSRGDCEHIFQLLPADTSCAWWHAAVPRVTSVLFYKRRIRFLGAKGSPKFPSALLYLGEQPKRFEACLGDHGWVVGGRSGLYERDVRLHTPPPLLVAA